ncbi:MAG: CRISPR-associated helicase Cas3' [Desulfopila sp.]
MPTLFYAHSLEEFSREQWQPLEVHLDNVAHTAKGFAAEFGADEWGLLAGLFHDAGKATQEFIRRLEGSAKRVDHSTFGARLAVERGGKLGPLLAYVIMGHHGGLPDGGLQEGQLHYRLRNGKVAADTALVPSVDVLSELKPPFLLSRQWAGFSLAFFTRMIFSCLVDADFLDTEKFCAPERTQIRHAVPIKRAGALRKALSTFISVKQRNAAPTALNRLRKEIVDQCRDKARGGQGLYSLTVPTGGGKTLSSLTFALEHAHIHGLSRVIYAVPFTSIIEQNAQVFRAALGCENVLEHHCNYREKDDQAMYARWQRLAAENWDAPVVVTTNVQFFESLYSNKTSRCRKLHNIAGSVIVLDEAQAIPTEYLEPCLAALKELVQHYRCTVVLCTATQPALDDTSSLRAALSQVQEIVENQSRLFTAFRRVKVDRIGQLSVADLAGQLSSFPQVLCIVATKREAQELYTQVAQRDGTFHLSTNMYPAHRTEVLERVRERLRMALPCRVIATSLVEAGVDLDFPVVYRAMTGLDSIAQAAGRCNREGLLRQGRVYVYTPEMAAPMPWLQRRISRAEEALRAFPGIDPLHNDVIRRYFELLFDVEDLDAKAIVRLLNQGPTKELSFPFREVAESFHFIADDGVGVIIPVDEAVERHITDIYRLRFPRQARRLLQQYTVSVRKKTFAHLVRSGAIEMMYEDFPVLRNMAVYDEAMGLVAERGELWDPEDLIG